ncbi:MAG TPA: patatin-like phospholipase family protein [Gemmatimonadales bacterium]|nr:patatin-like phospholipase family protein [Gemmatimonadales bacterium]
MATRRGRRGRGLGLALAGGGPGGAVYEIGALRALEEAVEGLDLTACDVYVGVSAGAFVASTLANGQGSALLVRGLVTHEPGEHPFDPAAFFLPAYREWARRGLQLPKLVADALLQFTRAPQDQSLIESLSRLTRALPLGLFDNRPIRRYLEETFARPGRTDDFRKLSHKLFVVSADLESGKAIVFGSKGWDHVPISLAVQASTALPGLYPPVEIDDRMCVDGVLLRTLHASVALEHGADLLFCINPLVPVDVAEGEQEGKLMAGSLRRRGLPALLSQTFRTLIHSRMVVGMSRYRNAFPDADVVLLEPKSNEYGLFFSNIFSFRTRREVCEIAYRSTRADLWRRREELEPMLRRHGLRLRTDVLRDPGRDVWHGVGVTRHGRRPFATDRLTGLLAELEHQAPTVPRRRVRPRRSVATA